MSDKRKPTDAETAAGNLIASLLDAVNRATQSLLGEKDAEISRLKGDNIWKSEVLGMTAETLKQLGCCHDHELDRSTPPMNYADWIKCVVRKREKEIERLKQKVECEPTDPVEGGD